MKPPRLCHRCGVKWQQRSGLCVGCDRAVGDRRLKDDLPAAEIERLIDAHMAHLRATRAPDALVAGSIASSLTREMGIPKGFRLR